MERARACGIDSCEKLVYRRELCPMHYHRLRRHGDPLVKLPPGGGPRYGSDHPMWKGSEVGYFGMHMRLRSTRGLASQHACHRCGGQAAQWAYTYDDPDQLADSAMGCPYSVDPACYVPMCVSCHKTFDLAQRQARRIS